MNFEDFYKPLICHKKKLAKHLEVKGFIKKKKEKSMTRKLGFLDKSQKQYFQFFDEGKILAYFEQDPNESKAVYNYVYMADVNQVQENLDGKKDHFGLVTNNGTITFKCENEKERKQWIQTMKYFAAMFSPIGDRQCKDLVEDVNVRTLAIITRELEIIQWQKHKKYLDQTNFIKAKGLVPIFTKNDLAVLKHRILISNNTFQIESKEDEEQKKEQRGRSTSRLSKKGSIEIQNTSNQFFMLITQKQSYKMDYKYREKEKIILNKSNLILGYDFDLIYLFNMKDADDYSSSYRQIQMKDILGVWIEKNQQNLKLILDQENLFVKFQTSIEAINWVEALDKCYDESFQKSRLELEYIKFDVDFFYEIFLDQENPKRFQSLLDALNKQPKKDDSIDEQLECFKDQYNNIKDLIDCFYSNKPFYAKMFMKIMNYLNKEYFTSLNKFWKVNLANIESEQILVLMNLLNQYQELLKQWNFVFQPTFYQDAFFNCYLGKEFQEQNENIYDILNNFSDNTTNLEDALNEFKECIIRQTNSIQYFNQRREILQLYQNISIIISQFFSYILKVLEQDQQELESLIDIVNQSFQNYFEQIIEVLTQNSQKKLNQEEIRQIILQEDLQLQINDIKKSCVDKIKKKLLLDLNTKIEFSESLVDININQNLKRPLREIIEKIQKLNDEKMSKNLIGISVTQSCDKYLKMFLSKTDQINNTNREDIALQLSSAQNCFRQLLKDSKIKKQNVVLRLKYLLKLYQTNNLDEFIIKEFTEQDNIKRLLRTKIYFPQDSIDYLRQFFENIQPTYIEEANEDIQEDQQTEQNQQKKAKSSQSFYYVVLFIKKLSNLKRKKSLGKKKQRSCEGQKRYRTNLRINNQCIISIKIIMYGLSRICRSCICQYKSQKIKCQKTFSITIKRQQQYQKKIFDI